MEGNEKCDKNSNNQKNEDDKSKFEDDGEDLPDNFFDDFSNQDFMAGLDIVDDWIDEEENKDESAIKGDKKLDKTGKRPEKESSRYRDRRHRSRSPRRRSPRRRSPKRRSRSLHSPRRFGSRNRSPRRSPRPRPYRSSRSPRRRRSRSKHADIPKSTDESGRRDPEKTKRDIQRDKIRCAKDHEARVFQEQLKVAETGLVPPGMELDIVLQSELFKDKDSKVDVDIKENDERKKEDVKESSRVSADQRKKRRHSRSRRDSSIRKYSRSRSRPRISSSPKRWRRSRSYDRDRDYRLRKSSRDIDLRYHLREKRERFKHDLSPISDKKLSRSPVLFDISPESNISERETWLRSKDRRSRNYSRSISPRYPKKFSFMEEIEIKLGQSNSNKYNPTLPQLMAVPVSNPNTPEFFTGTSMNFQPNPPMFMGPNIPGPAMVPPPDPFQFQSVQYPINLPNQPQPPPQMMNFPVQPVQFPQIQQAPAPPIVSHPMTSGNFKSTTDLNIHQEENQELAKLFEDKKISLSDFLSVSAKSIDGSGTPELHSRIKIISRCQEAIKTVEDSNILGRFIPKKTTLTSNENETKHDEKTKNQSPMRKVQVVRFNFTTPVNKRQHANVSNYPSTRGFIHKVLMLLGMGKIEETTPTKAIQKPQPQQVTAIAPTPVPPPVITPKKSNISTQTEPVKCQVCEVRKSLTYESTLTQTIEPTTYDVSTQVNIEDLNKSPTFGPRSILKSTPTVQSIAHLTPSQILAQLQNEKKEDINKPWIPAPKKETFPPRDFQDQFSPNKPRPLMDDNFNRNQFDFPGGFRPEQPIGGRRPAPFVEPPKGNRGQFEANRPFDATNRPFEPNNRLFDPNNRPFDPNNRPYDTTNRSFDPTNRPFDPTNRQFDPPNRPFEPTNRPFDAGLNRQLFDSGPNRPFDGPFDPRRFFEPNNPGMATNNRFMGTNPLNSKIYNRGPN